MINILPDCLTVYLPAWVPECLTHLHFSSRIPPRVHNEDVVSRGEVQSHASSLKRDEQHVHVGLGGERLDDL